MEQQLVGLRRFRISSWLLAGLLLTTLFLIINRELISGARVQIWDAYDFYSPAFSLVADHARHHRLLLWDPWLAAGTPDFADPQVGAASPIAIVAGAIGGGNSTAFRIYWLFIWFLGPLGLLLLARHLGAPPWGAFLVALGYSFCGFYTAHAEHTTVLYSFSFVPWFIWRFDVALTSLRFQPAAQAGALWGLSALGGYPAIVILSGGLLFLWGVARCCSPDQAGLLVQKQPIWGRFKFTFLALATVFCVGVLIMAPTYLAFFREGFGYTERAGAEPRWLVTAGNALDPGALATFVSPYLTALKFPSRNPELWPKTNISMADVYVGVLPLTLSLLALWHRPRSIWRWWLVGIIVFSLACAVGDRLPVRGWLYDYCPPTRYFAYPAMFRGYAIFSAAVLALLATSDLEAAIQNHKTRIWWQLTVLSVAASIAAVWTYVRVVSHVTDLGNQFPLSNLHLAGIWFGVVAVAVLLFLFQGTRKWLPILFGVLAILDASLTLRLSQEFMSTDSRWGRSLVNRADAGHKTKLSLKSLQRKLDAPSHLGGAHSNNSLTLRIATFYNDSTMKNRFHRDFANHPVLLKMGLGADRIWFADDAVVAAPSQHVYNALVYRSEELGAPVMVVHPSAQMAKVSDFRSPVVPDKAELASIFALSAAQNIPARVLRYTSNELELNVSCPADGWLLVTDRWAAGWRAKVNGISAEVFGGNFIFRAVRVRSGENTIHFYYPQHLYLAMILVSWSTLVAVFVVPGLNAIKFGQQKQLLIGRLL